MSCGVGWRRNSDPVLLRLWYRLVATAPIKPLASICHRCGPKKTKRKKKKNSQGNRDHGALMNTDMAS